MSAAIEARIREIHNLFEAQDIELAFRRTLDSVMDSDDMTLYQEAIDLTQWKYEHPDERTETILRAKALLEKTARSGISLSEPNTAVITADQIIKRYGNSGFSLGPISLSINKGQVYGLVGENGNGKTTLLRMIARELSLDSGSIDYRFKVPAHDDYSLRTRLIYIPQRTEKWYGSLKDNLRFVLASYGTPAAEIEPRMMLIICRLGLWKYQNLQWYQLSSGYKMRFELARTLLRQPEVLLLDEPLANLDVVSQQIILEDLKYICNSLRRPIAMILSSQQLYEVEKVSDRVIFLKDGKYNEHQQSHGDARPEYLLAEIDTTMGRAELEEMLQPIGLQALKFNGGVYIAQFNTDTSFADVLRTLGDNKAEIVYIRNISNSSRRFFIS